ncbi:MAG: aminodeoxychorismate/anthranilate synthase component II [Actinomycetota bacterium]|nr:aminodeoxychorismate/anthranilate synthase component II [Actinomycetota bacterium]
MRLLLIDNYDSFVYNIAQLFGSLGADVVVVRNDAEIEDLAALHPDAIVVSPGPGEPKDAGVSNAAVSFFGDKMPVLGVCLGHQCIGTSFGAEVGRATVGPRHGKVAQITHDGTGVFVGLPSPFAATRYHSLAIDEASLPDDLVATAWSEDGTVMGVRHKERPIQGVQFHPESILCGEGKQLLANFLSSAEKAAPAPRP